MSVTGPRPAPNPPAEGSERLVLPDGRPCAVRWWVDDEVFSLAQVTLDSAGLEGAGKGVLLEIAGSALDRAGVAPWYRDPRTVGVRTETGPDGKPQIVLLVAFVDAMTEKELEHGMRK